MKSFYRIKSTSYLYLVRSTSYLYFLLVEDGFHTRTSYILYLFHSVKCECKGLLSSPRQDSTLVLLTCRGLDKSPLHSQSHDVNAASPRLPPIFMTWMWEVLDCLDTSHLSRHLSRTSRGLPTRQHPLDEEEKWVSAKEPCVSAKEPCVSAKEPYVGPRLPWHLTLVED